MTLSALDYHYYLKAAVCSDKPPSLPSSFEKHENKKKSWLLLTKIFLKPISLKIKNSNTNQSQQKHKHKHKHKETDMS